MFVTGICPTFRHPSLLANVVKCWELQTYPKEQRHLVILDDDGTFDRQAGDGWEVFTAGSRYPSLPDKYNALLRLVPPETEAILVIEDDDIYLPRYVEQHAAVLVEHDLSKPSRVSGDYPGHIFYESGAGRFHSSLGFRKELIDRIGGWVQTKMANFDQQFIGRLKEFARSEGSPWTEDKDCSYLYSWHTGAPHGQNTMKSVTDETWYDEAEKKYPKVPYVGKLVPQLDERTIRIFTQLGVRVLLHTRPAAKGEA